MCSRSGASCQEYFTFTFHISTHFVGPTLAAIIMTSHHRRESRRCFACDTASGSGAPAGSGICSSCWAFQRWSCLGSLSCQERWRAFKVLRLSSPWCSYPVYFVVIFFGVGRWVRNPAGAALRCPACNCAMAHLGHPAPGCLVELLAFAGLPDAG